MTDSYGVAAAATGVLRWWHEGAVKAQGTRICPAYGIDPQSEEELARRQGDPSTNVSRWAKGLEDYQPRRSRSCDGAGAAMKTLSKIPQRLARREAKHESERILKAQPCPHYEAAEESMRAAAGPSAGLSDGSSNRSAR